MESSDLLNLRKILSFFQCCLFYGFDSRSSFGSPHTSLRSPTTSGFCEHSIIALSTYMARHLATAHAVNDIFRLWITMPHILDLFVTSPGHDIDQNIVDMKIAYHNPKTPLGKLMESFVCHFEAKLPLELLTSNTKLWTKILQTSQPTHSISIVLQFRPLSVQQNIKVWQKSLNIAQQNRRIRILIFSSTFIFLHQVHFSGTLTVYYSFSLSFVTLFSCTLGRFFSSHI